MNQIDIKTSDIKKFFSNYSIEKNDNNSTPDFKFLSYLLSNSKMSMIVSDFLEIDDGTYEGFTLLSDFSDVIKPNQRNKFIELVFIVFQDFTKKEDDWHPWVGTYYPLRGNDIDSNFNKMLREGTIKYDPFFHDISDINSILDMFQDWFHDIEHLINEIKNYRSQKDFKIFIISFYKTLNEKNNSNSSVLDELKKAIKSTSIEEVFKVLSKSIDCSVMEFKRFTIEDILSRY